MVRDSYAVSENCEYFIKYNPKLKQESLVVTDVSVDDLNPMDHLWMDLF